MRVCQDHQCPKGKDYRQHLRYRLIISQTLSQQLGKYVAKPLPWKNKNGCFACSLCTWPGCIAAGVLVLQCLVRTAATSCRPCECQSWGLSEPDSLQICPLGGRCRCCNTDQCTSSSLETWVIGAGRAWVQWFLGPWGGWPCPVC